MFLFLFLSLFFYSQISNQLTYIKINNSGIVIYRPLRLKKFIFDWKEIRGFSISEFWYGKKLYSSKSLIIYSKTENPIEIINLFNLNFDQVFLSLKKNKVTKLGNETYQTGIWKRKYRF